MADDKPIDIPAEIIELGILRTNLSNPTTGGSKLSPNDVNDLTRFIKATIDGWLLRKK